MSENLQPWNRLVCRASPHEITCICEFQVTRRGNLPKCIRQAIVRSLDANIKMTLERITQPYEQDNVGPLGAD